MYTTITETIKVTVPPVIVTGRNIAHTDRSPVRRAFLVADLMSGRARLERPTLRQLASIAHASMPYVKAAQLVSTDPNLRASVLSGDVSLADAAAQMRPTRKLKPVVQSEITADDFIEMFEVIGPTVRAACMRAFVDEALDVVDGETTPTPVKGNGAYHAHV